MKDTILIVDDEELEIELASQIFKNKYRVITAKDGKQAINQLSVHYKDIIIILLDLVMPEMNGYQVLQILKSSSVFKDIPVAMVTANTDLSVEISCYGMGALSVIHKPFVAQVVQKQIDNIIEMHQTSLVLKKQLSEEHEKLSKFYNRLTDIISNLVEFRDLESGSHVKRVQGITKIIAEQYADLFPKESLTAHDIEIIVRASAIHDIGKIAIPDSILLKPGPLTEEERQTMMQHTVKGCEILDLLADVQDMEQLKVSYDICRYHHERYDGNGYPDHLKGNKIPLSAQIVSIADVYDALTSDRVYKPAYDKETAYQMILDGKCGVFSPKILKCFQFAKDRLEDFSDKNR